jgi:nucleoside-diphosphate-sugar epimerase
MEAGPSGVSLKGEVTNDPPEWLASVYGPARSEFSSAKAERVLGWRPRVELAAAQRETIRWLIENGRLPCAGAPGRETDAL